MAAGPRSIYVGGEFLGMAGVDRAHIAEVDKVSGQLTPWDPSADHEVWELEVSSNVVYAAGLFSQIGGADRSWFAALDPGTGRATAWNPMPAGGNRVGGAILVTDSTVYLGGLFASVQGHPRPLVAAGDTITGAPTPWNPMLGPEDRRVSALALAGDILYAGGWFTNVGALRRDDVAAIRTDTALPHRRNSSGRYRCPPSLMELPAKRGKAMG